MSNNQPQREVIFAQGMVPRPRGNAPQWVDYKVAFYAPDFIKTLQENQDANGWVNVQVKTAKKTGKQYAEIDTYGKDKNPKDTGGYRAPRPPSQQQRPTPPPFPSAQQQNQQNENHDDGIDDIPFA